jgi:SAM-dependent methyltransferase
MVIALSDRYAACTLLGMLHKPDYGIDAPGVVRNLILVGVAGLVLGAVVPPVQIGSVTVIMNGMFFGPGAGCLAGGLLMLVYSKWGKFRHRERMLNMIAWRGDEQVLDVGTGRGLLIIGAAKRLSTGTGTGIDIWSGKDLSNNSIEQTRANLEKEGVADKVELLSEDARKLGFPDRTFDVVLSNLCIHNIPSSDGRAQACREIARVLKPGGKAIISDFIQTGFYVTIFKEAGLIVKRSGYTFDFPPLRVIEAEKP